MKNMASTTSGLYNLSVGKIRSIPIAYPPISEQHRIVAKVDALMAICDRLEIALTEAASRSEALATAVVANTCQ